MEREATGAPVPRFFDGFDLVEPGLVPRSRWRPAPAAVTPRVADAAADIGWCGVAKLRSR